MAPRASRSLSDPGKPCDAQHRTRRHARAQHDRHPRRQFADVRRQPRRHVARAHGFDDRALIAQLRQRAQHAPVVVQPDAQQGDRGFVQSRGRDAHGRQRCLPAEQAELAFLDRAQRSRAGRAEGRRQWCGSSARAARHAPRRPGPPACRVRRRPARRPRSRPRAGWTDRPRPAPGRRAWRPSRPRAACSAPAVPGRKRFLDGVRALHHDGALAATVEAVRDHVGQAGEIAQRQRGAGLFE